MKWRLDDGNVKTEEVRFNIKYPLSAYTKYKSIKTQILANNQYGAYISSIANT